AVYLSIVIKPGIAAARLLRPIANIGVASYPLYLIHQDAGNILLRLAGVDQLTSEALRLTVRGALLPALLIGFAWAVHSLVERRTIKPLAQFLSKLAPDVRTRPAAQYYPSHCSASADREPSR